MAPLADPSIDIPLFRQNNLTLYPPIDSLVPIPYPKQLKKVVRKRRRGTAIVDMPEGVLIVAGKSGRFLLPGGAAEKGESRKAATIRELQEETTLTTVSMQYLFSYTGHIRWRKSAWVRDEHKVFLVETQGMPQPTHEIRELRFYQPGDRVRMSEATRAIINRYLMLKQQFADENSALRELPDDR